LRRRSHALFGAAAIGLTLLQAAPAQADDPVLVPPKLAASAPAEDPRQGAVPRVVVLLELDIDPDGKVTDARVIRSGGEELDAAALASARGFTFVPATRDGQPIPARIRYESVFEARQPATALPVEPTPEQPVRGTAPAHSTGPDPEAFGATARVEAPPSEVTKRTLERTELAGIAGTRGDALRGVELLPGVSRPAPMGGLPILRGANPFDSQVFMEGAPVPALYHIGGITSVVHARVLESVELYPSNFSVRYGRKMGGVIEAKLRDPRTDGLHGIADVSLLDTSLLVETPITQHLSVLATARRSNIDAVLNSAANSADLAITAAPVYWDYQSAVVFKPTDRDRVRLLAYGSSDRLALILQKPTDAEPSMRGNLESDTTFHRVQLGYRHRFAGGSEHNTELTYGREYGNGQVGKIARFGYTANNFQLRSEWIGVIAPELRVTGGVDVFGINYDGRYTGVPLPPDEGDHPPTLSTQKPISTDQIGWSWHPGAYLEAGIRPVPALLVTPGLRADYNDVIHRGAVDPRLSARLDVTETTTIKGGVGQFSQTPNEAEVLNPIGNPNLRRPRAIHVSAGVDQKVTDAFTVSAEGFVKWMDQITTTTPGGRAPFFVNAVHGRVYGGELLLRVRPVDRFNGFLSYTLMRSERANEGESFRLFNRDQTHILGATGVYRLGRGWEVGATIRYTSGTPYTPFVASTYDATYDVYQPRLGRPMSERNPAFARVDARVQKTWTFSKWSLAVYLDVQNVFNAENREGFTYSYDYRNREGVRGLPILPILGLRGEL
jgi:TonB family protein